MYLSVLTAPIQQNKKFLCDEQMVHAALLKTFNCKREQANILYRKDISRDGDSIILMVQSDVQPVTTDVLTVEKSVSVDERNSSIRNGSIIHFNCKLQPTIKKNGKRKAIRNKEDRNLWICRKLKSAGAEMLNCLEADRATTIFNHNFEGKIETFVYGGTLQVSDVDKFLKAYQVGIGPGKAYGCGMMILG